MLKKVREGIHAFDDIHDKVRFPCSERPVEQRTNADKAYVCGVLRHCSTQGVHAMRVQRPRSMLQHAGPAIACLRACLCWPRGLTFRTGSHGTCSLCMRSL